MSGTALPSDPTDRLLTAIENIDKKFDEKSKADNERFARLEADGAALRGAFLDLQGQLDTHGKLIASHATTMTEMAAASARAASIALEAKQDANRAVDESTKIVKSAIEIHGLSIATTVDAAVQKGMKPLVEQIVELKANDAELKTNDADQKQTLADQNTEIAEMKGMLKTVVKALGNPALRKVLIASAVIGALVGGAVAGYIGEHEAHKITAPAR